MYQTCSERVQKKTWFIGTNNHWETWGVKGIHVKIKWYEHQPEAVTKNDLCKILWDFTVQKGHFIILEGWHDCHL